MAMFFFGLGGLVYVGVLLLNAIAILSEDRFLARVGWGKTPSSPSFGGQDSNSFRTKAVEGIQSVRTVARIPLIFINTAVILYELIFG